MKQILGHILLQTLLNRPQHDHKINYSLLALILFRMFYNSTISCFVYIIIHLSFLFGILKVLYPLLYTTFS